MSAVSRLMRPGLTPFGAGYRYGMEASQRNFWLIAAALTGVAAILWLTDGKLVPGIVFALATVTFVAVALYGERPGLRRTRR
jgi:hypothetical protein